MKIKRINFFGGPAARKSTTSAGIFSSLKKKGYNCELITEYIKFWTYIKKTPKPYDQVYIFSKQLYKEYSILEGGSNLVINDSPLFLTCFYAYYYNFSCYKDLVNIAKQFDKDFATLNFLLIRDNKSYDEIGRFHSLKEAQDIDRKLQQFLKEEDIPYQTGLGLTNEEMLLDTILKKIEK